MRAPWARPESSSVADAAAAGRAWCAARVPDAGIQPRGNKRGKRHVVVCLLYAGPALAWPIPKRPSWWCAGAVMTVLRLRRESNHAKESSELQSRQQWMDMGPGRAHESSARCGPARSARWLATTALCSFRGSRLARDGLRAAPRHLQRIRAGLISAAGC